MGPVGKVMISTAIIPKDLNTDIARGEQTANAMQCFGSAAFLGWVLAVLVNFINWILAISY